MLRFYHDASGTQEITQANPDLASGAANFGNDLVLPKRIYIKSDDPDLTYENVSVYAVDDPPPGASPVTVEYAPDVNGNPGTYQAVLELPDGSFQTPVPVWRRVTATNMQAAFKRTDIEHEVKADEFLV